MNTWSRHIIKVFKPIRKMLSDLSIKFRLMLYFTLLTIILTLSTGLLSYYRSSKTIYEQSVLYTETILNQTINRIEQMKNDIMDISIPLLINPVIQRNDYNELNALGYMEKKRYIETELNKVDTMRNEICSIFICVEPEHIFSHNIVISEDEKLFKNYLVHRTSMGTISKPVWTGVHKNEFKHDENEYVLTFSRSIYERDTFKAFGSIIININQNTLRNICVYDNTEISYKFFIVDKTGKTIFNSIGKTGAEPINRDYLERILFGGKEERLLDYKTNEGSYLVNAVFSGDKEWLYIAEISMVALMENAQQIKQFTGYVLIVGFLISVIISYLLSNYFTNPFRRMIQIMRVIESGNLNIKTGIYNKSEIGVLSQSLDNMVEKIKQLIEKVKLEQEEKRKEELNTLQAQITPHFLYNSLNAIKCMARIQNSPGIEKMTVSLIELLQMSINKQEIFISVGEEIELVKKFIFLQNYRYGNRLSVHYECLDSVLGGKTLKLILQPIVENAILYGIESNKENGRIIIRAYPMDNKLILEVEDNGMGMTQKQIQEVLIEERSNTRRFSGIGIKNVNERIKMHFGPQYASCS